MAKPKTSRAQLGKTPMQLMEESLRTVGSRTDYRDSWTCPAHHDKKPSLSVTEADDGRVLLHCHAGCDVADILDRLGLGAADLFPVVIHPQLGRAVAVYTYRDERSEPLFQVCRFDPKTFRPRRPDGTWGLDGVRLVPYRLPAVLAAVKNGRPVFVVEGEKDADALDRAGVAATTSPGGAGRWRPEYAEHFRGAEVVVVADRDGPGRKHAAGVAASLAKVAAVVAVVEPKEGKDATDHLEAGHDPADFVVVDAAERVVPIDTGSLLEQVAVFVRRFVIFQSEAQVVAVALWVLHTHAFRAWEVTPYLHLRSAERRSGKTRLLEVLELLTPRARRDLISSAAAVFRTIAEEQPTLLLDEVDAIFGRKGDEPSEFLRAVLNAGYQAGASVPRVARVGNRAVVERYDTFCAKALAGIGKLPDTIADRCIPLTFKRKKKTDRAARFYRRDVGPEANGLYQVLARWAEDAVPDLGCARPDLPDLLHDRAADIWEPLLAIADLAGDGWGSKARAAAVELHGAEQDDDSVAVTLLGHIREAFDKEPPTDRLSTEELLRRLVDRDDAPWAGWWGEDLDDANRRKSAASRLARMLKPFEVEPKQIRVGVGKTRGYERAAFEDAWERYCAPRTVEKVGTTVQRRSEGVSADEGPGVNTGSDQGRTVVSTSTTVQGGGRSGPTRKRVRRRTGDPRTARRDLPGLR